MGKRIISGIIAGFSLAVFAMLTIIPLLMGAKVHPVLSNSMTNPKYDNANIVQQVMQDKDHFRKGDAAIIKEIRDTEEVNNLVMGDIILYDNKEGTSQILHQIIATEVDGYGMKYITKGSSSYNNAADEPVPTQYVAGKYLYKVPLVATIPLWATIVGSAAIFLVTAQIAISPTKKKKEDNKGGSK